MHLNEAGTKVFPKNIIVLIDFSNDQFVSDSSQPIKRSLMLNLNPEVEKPLDNCINGFTIYQDKSVPSGNQSNLKENDACPLEIIQNLKGFRIGHINIASLTKYIDQLQIYVQKESFDILSVNETRLDEYIIDSIVRKDRNRKGGGVAICHRNCTNIALRNDLIPEDSEAICIEVM